METEAGMNAIRSNTDRPNGENVITITDAGTDTDWLALTEEKLKIMPKLLKNSSGKDSCCIFRVPQSLVEINKKAYQPQIVSIGPYHYGKQHLKMIQEHKWRYLGSLISRTKNHGIGLMELFGRISSIEERIRDCYSENIEFTRREFIEMMVVDGCFIIELFGIVGRLSDPDPDDPIFNMVWIFSFLMRDLLRLENQIPLFVLESLFELTVLSSRKPKLPSLVQLSFGFFNHAVQRSPQVLENYKRIKGKHLLDLFRMSYLPSSNQNYRYPKKTTPSFLQLIPSAKNLHLAGIKFKARETETGSFLDIKFNKGVLQIPPFTIDDFTTSVFLNCVAFEQCYSHCEKHITTYVTFMRCLINTPSDAGLLCDHKIVENYFGTNEEVTRFFNNVGKDVTFDIQRCYLTEAFEEVNGYYRNGWHVRWAGFKHTYFDTPWSFMSALAALILLILTMIQSFYAVYGYNYPKKV